MLRWWNPQSLGDLGIPVADKATSSFICGCGLVPVTLATRSSSSLSCFPNPWLLWAVLWWLSFCCVTLKAASLPLPFGFLSLTCSRSCLCVAAVRAVCCGCRATGAWLEEITADHLVQASALRHDQVYQSSSPKTVNESVPRHRQEELVCAPGKAAPAPGEVSS